MRSPLSYITLTPLVKMTGPRSMTKRTLRTRTSSITNGTSMRLKSAELLMRKSKETWIIGWFTFLMAKILLVLRECKKEERNQEKSSRWLLIQSRREEVVVGRSLIFIEALVLLIKLNGKIRRELLIL